MRSSKLIQRSEKRVSKYQRTLNILNYLTCNLIEPRIFKLSILPSKSCYQSHLPTGFQLFERGKERGDFRVIDGDTRTRTIVFIFYPPPSCVALDGRRKGRIDPQRSHGGRKRVSRYLIKWTGRKFGSIVGNSWQSRLPSDVSRTRTIHVAVSQRRNAATNSIRRWY